MGRERPPLAAAVRQMAAARQMTAANPSAPPAESFVPSSKATATQMTPASSGPVTPATAHHYPQSIPITTGVSSSSPVLAIPTTGSSNISGSGGQPKLGVAAARQQALIPPGNSTAGLPSIVNEHRDGLSTQTGTNGMVGVKDEFIENFFWS
ncbi:unnamed protein product [Protopolystoma xenopodis]|uniref:Uncharacterized protein n=1 Tax=Protopolystoma xenopodis TaxID=117903 RepID=A0A3S5CQT1_9PLAT|nr:unnamed protein product [Protopolystoma xenopodis]